MTFTKPTPSIVASDEGFSVQIVAPSHILYTERGTVWDVATEWLMGAPPIVVYQADITPISGADISEPLSPARRNEMVANIRRALRFDGIEIDVE
ncbi:MAG: hypothetical protein NVS1B4_23220 [Gemmatimonadaceae bacterium]